VNDVYVPTMMQARVMDPQRGRSLLENANAIWLRPIGRLEPGMTREQAQSALLASTTELDADPAPKGPRKYTSKIILTEGSRGDAAEVKDLSLPLTLMMSVVGFVLLAACANIANLCWRARPRDKRRSRFDLRSARIAGGLSASC
jgi:hypothetical protein